MVGRQAIDLIYCDKGLTMNASTAARALISLLIVISLGACSPLDVPVSGVYADGNIRECFYFHQTKACVAQAVNKILVSKGADIQTLNEAGFSCHPDTGQKLLCSMDYSERFYGIWSTNYTLNHYHLDLSVTDIRAHILNAYLTSENNFTDNPRRTEVFP